MKLLLDTHAFFWWDDAPEKLSPAVRAACQDAANTLHLSLASAWEMQIKAQLGKMRLPLPWAICCANTGSEMDCALSQ